jgi:hypothetical protein
MTDIPMRGGSAVASGDAPHDAVSVFERHRTELKASKRVWNMIALGGFTVALGLSIWISNFYPDGSPTAFRVSSNTSARSCPTCNGTACSKAATPTATRCRGR